MQQLGYLALTAISPSADGQTFYRQLTAYCAVTTGKEKQHEQHNITLLSFSLDATSDYRTPSRFAFSRLLTRTSTQQANIEARAGQVLSIETFATFLYLEISQYALMIFPCARW